MTLLCFQRVKWTTLQCQCGYIKWRYLHVPSNFLKSVCAENFFWTAFYLSSSEFGMMCMKYVQKRFWREYHMRAPSFLLYVCPWPVCTRTSAHLRGNIACVIVAWPIQFHSMLMILYVMNCCLKIVTVALMLIWSIIFLLLIQWQCSWWYCLSTLLLFQSHRG